MEQSISMNVENNFLKNQIFLQFFIVTNYIFYIFSFNKYLIVANLLLILFYIFKNIIDNGNKRILLIKITIIIYIIISLGSPLIEWDARTIWLFHAKRIFFENNLYSQLDNYFALSHNDYPLFAATLSSSLALLINGWNEIFPKFSNVILMISPFMFLSFILKNKIKEFFFIFIIFFILGKRIIVGEMDMLVAIYFTLTCTSFGYLLFKKEFSDNYLTSYIFLNLIIYSLLKVESFIMISIIIFATILLKTFLLKNNKKNLNKFFILILSLIPVMHWKYLINKFNIESMISTTFDFNLLFSRIFDFHQHFKIFETLFYSKHSIITLLFLSFFIFSILKIKKGNFLLFYDWNLLKKNPISLFLILFSLTYFLIVYLAILISPSIKEILNEIGNLRYNVPVSVGICYAVIHFNYNKRKKNN